MSNAINPCLCFRLSVYYILTCLAHAWGHLLLSKKQISCSPICPSFLLVAGLLRKSLPIPIASRVFPALSCTNFRVSGLILRSLIHFELILEQGDIHGSSFSFLQTDNHFSEQHLLKKLFSIVCFWHICQK
jgi:hypothetical protein